MNVPGSNLLALALSVITPQTVGYLRYLSKTTNAVGVDVPTFAPKVDLRGSFQPVDAMTIQRNGLDMGKRYATFYASGDFAMVYRDDGADRFVFGGRLWSVMGKTDWFLQDGWGGALCVDIGPADDAG